MREQYGIDLSYPIFVTRKVNDMLVLLLSITDWQANFDDVPMESSASAAVAMDTTSNPWENSNATCKFVTEWGFHF